MNREDLIKKYILKHEKGIEISPWHNPIVPKRNGYNVQILDILDTTELIEKFKADPNSIQKNVTNIEHVDFVESALSIDKAVEKINGLETYDYIISSHNFEHLPNPIKFLKACAKVLKIGGHLSMAIPCKTHTFDYFRRLTTTTDFLEMFFENQERPNPYQIYDFISNFINNNPNQLKNKIKFNNVDFSQDLKLSFEGLRDSFKSENTEYVDVHVSVFTPDSFNLIINELITLELIPFKIKELIPLPGFEFFVHLQKINSSDFSKYKLSSRDRINMYKKLYDN